MKYYAKPTFGHRAAAFALAAVTTFAVSFPTSALAQVTVDGQELAQGENSVGGGTATLRESALDMAGVTATTMRTDEDLTVNFNGGNNIEVFDVTGSANVEVNFSGENEVEDTHAHDQSNVTVNANEHNDFEEVEAYESARLTVNVSGENDFETIACHDDASVTVRGVNCQR